VSSFLTAHQHILGYSVPFIHSFSAIHGMVDLNTSWI